MHMTSNIEIQNPIKKYFNLKISIAEAKKKHVSCSMIRFKAYIYVSCFNSKILLKHEFRITFFFSI